MTRDDRANELRAAGFTVALRRAPRSVRVAAMPFTIRNVIHAAIVAACLYLAAFVYTLTP